MHVCGYLRLWLTIALATVLAAGPAASADAAYRLRRQTLVPAPAVLSWLGLSCEWDVAAGTLRSRGTWQGRPVSLTVAVGQDQATINDGVVDLTVPAERTGDTVYLPLRVVTRLADVLASYDRRARAVVLTAGDRRLSLPLPSATAWRAGGRPLATLTAGDADYREYKHHVRGQLDLTGNLFLSPDMDNPYELRRVVDNRVLRASKEATLELAADGRTAFEHDGDAMRLLELPSLRELARYQGLYTGWDPEDLVRRTGLLFTESNKDSVTWVWDRATHRQLAKLPGTGAHARPGGPLVLTSQGDPDTTFLNDVTTGKLVAKWPGLLSDYGSPGGRFYLINDSAKNTTTVVDLLDGSARVTVPGEAGGIDPYGDAVLTTKPVENGEQTDVSVYDVPSGKLRFTFRSPTWTFAFSPDGRYLVVVQGKWDEAVLRDAHTGQRLRYLGGENVVGEVDDLNIYNNDIGFWYSLPDGKLLAAMQDIAYKEQSQFWDRDGGQVAFRHDDDTTDVLNYPQLERQTTLKGTLASLSGDGRRIATYTGGQVVVWGPKG